MAGRRRHRHGRRRQGREVRDQELEIAVAGLSGEEHFGGAEREGESWEGGLKGGLGDRERIPRKKFCESTTFLLPFSSFFTRSKKLEELARTFSILMLFF
jgi:hypothetical protein